MRKVNKKDDVLKLEARKQGSGIDDAMLERRTLAFQNATSRSKENGGCKQQSYPMPSGKSKS